MRTSSSYCPPLSFTPAHSWWVIHHRRRPLSFLWLGWLAGLTGWLAGLLGFWLSGPCTRVPPRLFRSFSLPLPLLCYSLFFLFLLLFLLSAASQTSMYSFYSYTGAVPTCSSGSAGRSFALLAYRYSRISPGWHILQPTRGEMVPPVSQKFYHVQFAQFTPAPTISNDLRSIFQRSRNFSSHFSLHFSSAFPEVSFQLIISSADLKTN